MPSYACISVWMGGGSSSKGAVFDFFSNFRVPFLTVGTGKYPVIEHRSKKTGTKSRKNKQKEDNPREF